MVPRMLAVAGYFSVTNVNCVCPLAAKVIASVTMMAPELFRIVTGIFTCPADIALTAMPV